MIIDELPIESTLVPQIRELLGLRSIYSSDLYDVRFGIERLKLLAQELRRHLLPVLRDRLRISGFTRSSSDDEIGRLHRQFVAVAFPSNLEHLEDLTRSLELATEHH